MTHPWVDASPWVDADPWAGPDSGDGPTEEPADALGLSDAVTFGFGRNPADDLGLTDLGQQEHPPHRASTVVLASSGISDAVLESDGLSTAVIATS